MFVVAAAAVASVAVNVDGWGIVSPLNAQVANIFVYILAEGEQGSDEQTRQRAAATGQKPENYPHCQKSKLLHLNIPC